MAGLTDDEFFGSNPQQQSVPPQQGMTDDEFFGQSQPATIPPSQPDTSQPKVGFWQTVGQEAAQFAPALYAGARAAPIGAEAGTAVGGPIGGLIGGVGAALAGGYAGQKAFNAARNVTGLDQGTGFLSDAAIQAGEEQHPYAKTGADLAALAASFGTGIGQGISLGTRALGGAVQGGLAAGQEYAQNGKFNPEEIATQAAEGALFTTPRGWTQKLGIPGTPTRPGPVQSDKTSVGGPDAEGSGIDPVQRAAERNAAQNIHSVDSMSKGAGGGNIAPQPVKLPNTTGGEFEGQNGMLKKEASDPNDPDRNYGENAGLTNQRVDTVEPVKGVQVLDDQSQDPTIAAAMPKEEAAPTGQPTEAAPAQNQGQTPPPQRSAAVPSTAQRSNISRPDLNLQPNRAGTIPARSNIPADIVSQAVRQAPDLGVVEHPMPSIANSSKDPNGPIVVDPIVVRDHPEYVPHLAVHEHVERTLEQAGYPYDVAHHVATLEERASVERAGIDWGTYSKYFDGVGKRLEKQAVEPPFPLASDPYADLEHHLNKDQKTQQALDWAHGNTPKPGEGPEQFPQSEAKPTPTVEKPEAIAQPNKEDTNVSSTQQPPKDLKEATEQVRQATGLKEQPKGAEAAIDASVKGPIPKSTRNVVAQALDPLNKVLSVRGRYNEPSKASATTLRKFAAQRQQTKDQVMDAVEPLRPIVNKMPDTQQRELQMAIEEGDKTGLLKSFPELQPIADALGKIYKDAGDRLVKANLLDPKYLIENYFRHQWEDPEKAAQFVENWYTKQGSSSAIKQREIPTIREGLSYGLKLKYDDPLAVTTDYINKIENFIALNKALEEGKDQGWIHGSMQPGDVKLDATELRGQTMYAPADWARNFNNFYNNGFHATEAGGKLYDVARRGSNFVTAIELAGPAFHAVTMANEAIMQKMASALSLAAGGQGRGALKRLGQTITAPYDYYKAGKVGQQEWLNPGTTNPDTQKVVQYLRDAGARAIGFTHDPTYEYTGSPMDTFWKSWTRGSFGKELEQAKGQIGEAFQKGPVQGVASMAGQVFHNVGRALQTVQAPLFEHAIPRIKMGASMELLGDWVRSNPDASPKDIMGAAQRIVDTTDDRFGEMVQDNIFWSKTLKESAQLMMRSYSWNLGTFGVLGGGSAKIAMNAMNPQRLHSLLSIGSKDYDPRVAYTLALPIVVGMTSAIYQYLKTGETPQDVRDLVAGRTGGRLNSGLPERAIFPGYEKDVLGWFNDYSSEAANKIATAPRALWENLVSNKDWKDQPIANMNDPLSERIKQHLADMVGRMVPIYAQQLNKPASPNSNIGPVERALALRPAPGYISGVNPKQEKAVQYQWQQKLKTDRRLAQ